MADLGDILDLYGSDPEKARSQANLLAQAMRRRRGAADLATVVGGPFAAAGKAFGGDADQMQAQLLHAAQARPAALKASIEAQRAQEEADAWKHPAAGSLLRGAIQQFMPNLPVDENTPTQVLRNIAPMAEKYGGTLMGGMIKAGTPHGAPRWVTDQNTGQHYIMMPDGSTWFTNGQPRSPALPGHAGIPGMPGIPGAASVPGPIPTPAAAPPGPAAALRPAGSGTFPRMMGKPLGAALQALGKDFDPNAAGSPEITKNQARVNAARRIRALAEDETGQPRDLIPQQMTELSQAVATLLSTGGQPSERITRELTPYTSGRKWSDVVQWLTNEPHGAGQREFVRLMTETAKREESVAQKGIADAIGARAGKHQRVLRGNPAEAKATLEPFGWTIDEKGKVVPKEQKAPPEAPKAEGSVRVRRKSDGKTGSMPAQNFNPDLYEKIE